MDKDFTWQIIIGCLLIATCIVGSYLLGHENGFVKGMTMTADRCALIITDERHKADSICTARIARQFRTPPDTTTFP